MNFPAIQSITPLILASRSPRRRELLEASGFAFDIIVPDEDAEDARHPAESPDDYVCRVAIQKAKNVAEKVERGLIVSCDTVVLGGNEILFKPADRDDARRMLRLLRGTRHRVLSGLCLGVKKTADDPGLFSVETETTDLFMQPVSDELLESYLDSEAWKGKAGAFGYQDRHDWISIVEGSETNVVGLPMELLEKMLSGTY